MSARKVKRALIARCLKRGYRGFMPVKEKIARDVRSINKARKYN